MSTALTNLTASGAKLPTVYKAAVDALATCERIDECKDWSDKAEAIASYARQSRDETLLRTAMRIKGRAVRRAGELLEEIPAEKPGPKPESRAGAGPESQTRADIAEAAGLSGRQVKDALRIAAVPELRFEAAIEAEKPATVTELAKMGTKKKKPSTAHLHGRDPEDFRASTLAQGACYSFVKETTGLSQKVALRGMLDHERSDFKRAVASSTKWLAEMAKLLEKTK